MSLTYFLFLLTLIFQITNAHEQSRICSIMIDPAGDAQNTGRKLHDSFERGITLQCAEHLKQLLESTNKQIRVVLTRWPGETLEPLQNANFANRLDIQLYLSIHFYQEKERVPKLYLYQLSYSNDTFFPTKKIGLTFTPYDQAHLESSTTTQTWALKIKEHLELPEYEKLFEVKGIFKIPFKPLVGIKAPAFAIEVGLKNKDDWKLYSQAFAQSLGPIIELLL